MTPEDPPNPRDTIVIAALVAGRTWEEAGKQANCSRSTVQRVAREYAHSIAAERAERARRVADRLRDAALLAVDVVCDVLEHEENNAVRLQAARIAIGDALRWLAQVETDERLEALEALSTAPSTQRIQNNCRSSSPSAAGA